ncbi:MAG: signal recognition particle-docking protein FtsY [Thiocapsa sp.]|nr:signal recognition particle-docking protein FtsY [Thiocapsa sp.]MCG6896678.1 signal recognition particle-docking protein FtsY [Thiocapsa sp.]MCG6984727.1 signal recognition particle-docking protein FtsY [Thiocapsa sp.]
MFGFGKKHRKATSPQTEQAVMPQSSPPADGDGTAVSAGASRPRGPVVAETRHLPPTAPPTARTIAPPDRESASGQPPTESEPRTHWFRPRRRPEEAEASRARTAPSEVDTSGWGSTRVDEPSEKKSGVFSRLRERLSRTRAQLGDGIGTLVAGRKRIDDDLMEELETLLLTADVGVTTTARIMDDLTNRVKRKSLSDPQALLQALKAELRDILISANAPVRQPAPGKPQVILMVGVNGAGKTTTIGKLAKRLQEEGNQVILAAGDTFRAAAVEQLQTWGERNRVTVVSQQSGADSASVIFDALQAATARGADVLIADTAGRLHTKSNLMDELTKVARVLKKIDPDAPHEVMLVVDATTGQNALNQALHFHRAVGLTGITLTKLDGTAKGGILFAIADRLKLPIRFIGVGETIDDLRPFDADEFLDALLG